MGLWRGSTVAVEEWRERELEWSDCRQRRRRGCAATGSWAWGLDGVRRGLHSEAEGHEGLVEEGGDDRHSHGVSPHARKAGVGDAGVSVVGVWREPLQA